MIDCVFIGYVCTVVIFEGLAYRGSYAGDYIIRVISWAISVNYSSFTGANTQLLLS